MLTGAAAAMLTGAAALRLTGAAALRLTGAAALMLTRLGGADGGLQLSTSRTMLEHDETWFPAPVRAPAPLAVHRVESLETLALGHT